MFCFSFVSSIDRRRWKTCKENVAVRLEALHGVEQVKKIFYRLLLVDCVIVTQSTSKSAIETSYKYLETLLETETIQEITTGKQKSKIIQTYLSCFRSLPPAACDTTNIPSDEIIGLYISDIESEEEEEKRKEPLELHDCFSIFEQPKDIKEQLKSLCIKFTPVVITQVRNKNQESLLHLAIAANSLPAVKILLDHGTILSHTDSYGWTPLHMACYYGFEEIIRELLFRSSPVCSLTNHHSTPMHFLIQSNIKWECMHMLLISLLEEGADINAADLLHGTPLYYACAHTDNQECILFLLHHGASPNILYENGQTSLHVAVQGRKYSVTRILLQNGANPRIQYKCKGDALELAKETKREGLIELVKEFSVERANYLPEPCELRSCSLSDVKEKRFSPLDQFTHSWQLHLKEELGIPSTPQHYVESYPCSLNSNQGYIHVWQFHLAFESTPVIHSETRKTNIIPIHSITICKKTFVGQRPGIEIRTRSQLFLFSSLEYFFEPAYNVIQFLCYTTEQKYSIELDSLPFRRALGEIKFPEVSREMKQKFGSMLEEGEALIDFCNCSAHSGSFSNVSLGTGRLYLTLSGILYYSQFYEIEEKLFIPYESILAIKEKEECSLAIRYTTGHQQLSRIFKTSSKMIRIRIYGWIEEEWRRIVQPAEKPLVALISPPCQLLDHIIEKVNGAIVLVVVQLEASESNLDILLTSTAHTNSHHYGVLHASLDTLADNTHNITHIYYHPPLVGMEETTKQVLEVIQDIPSLRHFFVCLPRVFLQAVPSWRGKHEYLAAIQRSKEKIIFFSNNSLCSVTLLETNPVMEMFEFLIDCSSRKVFIGSPHPIAWLSLPTLADVLKNFFLQSYTFFPPCISITGSEVLLGSDIVAILNKKSDSPFSLEKSRDALGQRIKEKTTNHSISKKEGEYLYNLFMYVQRSNALEDRYLTDSLFLQPISFSMYLQNNQELYHDAMSSFVLYYKESEYLKRQFLLFPALDEKAMFDVCGFFLGCCGLSLWLFRSLGDEEGKINANSFIKNFHYLLHGSPLERATLVFKMTETSGAFYRENIDAYVSIVDMALHGVQKEYPVTTRTAEQLESFRNQLFENFRICGSGAVSLLFPEFLTFFELSSTLIQSLGTLEEMEEVGEGSMPGNPPGNPIIFGHPQWDLVWHIMKTIEHSERLALIQQAVPEVDCFISCEHSFESNQEVWFITDHCPSIFKRIREKCKISSKSYLNSLGSHRFIGDLLIGAWTSYREISSTGRSGSLFYSSWDGKFFLKTIQEEEEHFLLSNLQAYYYYLSSHPSTLLIRFYGLHRIQKGNQGETIRFVVMENILHSPHFPVSELYDLKGSIVNRHVELSLSRHEAQTIARKDNDFKRFLKVGTSMKARLLEVIEKDIRWLESLNITDYSLLVGLHNLRGSEKKEKMAALRYMEEAQQNDSFLYGLVSEDKTEVYYIGIIDILGVYNYKKKGERFVKRIFHAGNDISASPPHPYRIRFQKYMATIFQ